MICPICGNPGTTTERRTGKGRFNYTVGILAALFTGGIGIVAGFVDHLSEKEYIICEHCGYRQFDRFQPHKWIKYDRNNLEFTSYHTLPLKTIEEKLNKIIYARQLSLATRYADYDDGFKGRPCLVLEHATRPNDYLQYIITTDGYEHCYVYRFGKIRTVENARELHQNAIAAIKNAI